MKTERITVRLVLVASGLMLIWMARPLLTGTVPFTGDLLHFHYPVRDFYHRALASGLRIDWMPELFGGFYVAGEGQLGPYHPVHLALYGLLPLDAAFGVEIVAAYPFMFAGAWLFLRLWVDRAPAAFGAMLCTFSGFMLSHGVHVNMVSIVAHLPWLLWAIHRASTVPDRRARSCAAIALLTGSQILLGHPQATWLSLMIELAYVAFLLATRLVRGRGLMAAVGGKALGIGVGAVQLLATLQAFQQSTRAADDTAFAVTYALTPVHVWQLLHPYLFWERISRWSAAPGAGDEYAAYGGAVALVLSAWWLALRFTSRDHGTSIAATRLARWAGVLACIGLWLALGARGGLYLLQTWLPLVGGFRVPARFIFLTQFGLAVVAAVVLAHLLQSPQHRQGSRRQAIWVPWGVAAASLVSAVWLSFGDGAERIGRAAILAAAAGPVLIGLAAMFVTLAARGARWAVAALVLLAAGDQALYGLAGVVAWQDVVTRQEAESFLDTGDAVPPGPYRMAHGGFPNLYVLAGYRALDGYAGLTPARILDYRAAQALRVAQVGYAHAEFQARANVPGAEALPGGWYRLPAPVARARLVSRSTTSRDPAGDITRIDVDADALVARDLVLGGGPAGIARIRRDDPGSIQVQTEAPTQQLLVMSESFDAGWVASIDGRDAEVERVNGDFLGIVVPPGAHEATLTFDPLHLIVGRWISLSAGVVALILLVVPYRSRSSNR